MLRELLYLDTSGISLGATNRAGSRVVRHRDMPPRHQSTARRLHRHAKYPRARQILNSNYIVYIWHRKWVRYEQRTGTRKGWRFCEDHMHIFTARLLFLLVHFRVLLSETSHIICRVAFGDSINNRAVPRALDLRECGDASVLCSSSISARRVSAFFYYIVQNLGYRQK